MEEEKIETETSPEKEFISSYAADFRALMEDLLEVKAPWELKEIVLNLWASLIVKFLMVSGAALEDIIKGVVDLALTEALDHGHLEKKDEV
ncbi:MAG: hypothetical protein BWZ03_00732 [bacterium ADurb.BinA186]|nr:MAG: hypothetical protein BWZ03_00732 [bacterium ADurb.BinA186]